MPEEAGQTGPGLHGDPETWSDGLGEPGDYRLHEPCENCGCSGLSSAVRFVPVWENGDGILTAGEAEEVLGKAKSRILEIAELEIAGKLPPLTDALGNDIVLRVEGRRDGTFRAVIIAVGGGEIQTNNRYGAGSVYRGARGWRHALRLCRYTREVTTDADLQQNMLVFEGEPGILTFMYRENSTSVQNRTEQQRIRRALRDRTSRTTAYERNTGRAAARAADREERLRILGSPPEIPGDPVPGQPSRRPGWPPRPDRD